MGASNHHFLITGELVFHEKDKPEIFNSIRVNGILIMDTTNIGVHAIGKSQQVLQANFFKKMGDPTLIIVDVVITNFCYLGFMTEEEFKALPPGFEVKEKAPETEAPATAASNDAPAPGTGDALDQAMKGVEEGTVQ